MSPPFPVCDVAMIPGLLPIFLHGCEIKSGSGLGMRLSLLTFIVLSLISANVDFPTDLDYSFHTGQLNTTLNSLPPLQLGETECSDSQLESGGNTSHCAVPDTDNSLASLTSDVPFRDELIDNTDFYDHDLPVTRKVKSTAAACQDPPANPPLPVLFYPRKKGIVRKRKTNVHRRK